MKNLFGLLATLILIHGCAVEFYPSNWEPEPYHFDIPCCMTQEQAKNAIYDALLRRKWTVSDIQRDTIFTELSCGDVKANVIIKVTDKDYTLSLTDIMESGNSDHHCVDDKVYYLVEKTLSKRFEKIRRRNAVYGMKGPINVNVQ